MCIECIFNYFLLPAGGAYAIYYLIWIRCGDYVRRIAIAAELSEASIKQTVKDYEAQGKERVEWSQAVQDQLNEEFHKMEEKIDALRVQKSLYATVETLKKRVNSCVDTMAVQGSRFGTLQRIVDKLESKASKL